MYMLKTTSMAQTQLEEDIAQLGLSPLIILEGGFCSKSLLHS